MTDTSEWNISDDIYSIVDSVNKLKARYVEDEDETTLALGIFGFLGDTEAKKIQTSTIMAGELGNEMFPTRAKLDKNILTHAIYANIEGINATPAKLSIDIGIKISDFDKYMVNNQYILDHNCIINIGGYQFHLDYDIIIKRYIPLGSTRYVYTASYDMAKKNAISDITNPYLTQPLVQIFNNYEYLFLSSVTIHQVTINEISDRILTNSIIDNKSYTFTFPDQLADFTVKVTDNGVTTELTPLFYGSSIEEGVTRYCWYLYINDNTIRIGFDANSYTPGLNSEIEITTYTTKGAEGNFTYSNNEDNNIFCDFVSKYSNNKKIVCFIRCETSSENGKDRKSTAELKNLIPKMAMSRGYITTETDLNNYFKLISDDDNIIQLQKKVDNQLARVWYAYYLLKDQNGNIIPTNTCRIKVNLSDRNVMKSDDGRYIIPAGTKFVYDPKLGYAVISQRNPTVFSNEYFSSTNEKYYYRTPQNIVLNLDPLYAAYYMTIINNDSYFNYYYTNEDSYLGFITIRNNFKRNLLSDQNSYVFTFSLMQNINEDYGLLDIDQDTYAVKNCKIHPYLVIENNNVPYRFISCTLEQYSDSYLGINDNNGSGYVTDWSATITTDNGYDSDNCIRITNMCDIGYYNAVNVGYADNNCKAYLYIAVEFRDSNGNLIVYPDKNDALTTILGDNENRKGLSLVNIYEINGGLTFFTNFTSVMDTKIVVNKPKTGSNIMYDIYGVPLVGEHFFTSEENVDYFANQLLDKKRYIDYCLRLVENNMSIDFKLYNTYGHSYTYTMGDKDDTTIGHLDISMKFRLKLASSVDLSTRDSIILYIKNYIEDLNQRGDLHIPNLLHDIKEEYGDSIVYIEYMNFNENRLGINHIELRDVIDPTTVPEFINVRNKLADDGITLEPCIDIEVVID